MPSDWTKSVRAIQVLVALLFAVYNLVPLYGLWAWHWDAFQLLILYWSETVVLAGWTMVRLSFVPTPMLGDIAVNDRDFPATHAALIGIMLVVAGMFCSVHLMLLFSFFGGDWSRRLHGIGDFLRTFYIDSDAWIPLSMVTLAGGIDSLIGEYRPHFMDAVAQRLRIALPAPSPRAVPGGPVADILGTVFNRIGLMQVAVVCGAWFLRPLGSLAPLAIIVALKTFYDFGHRTGMVTGELVEA